MSRVKSEGYHVDWSKIKFSSVPACVDLRWVLCENFLQVLFRNQKKPLTKILATQSGRNQIMKSPQLKEGVRLSERFGNLSSADRKTFFNNCI